MAFHERSPSRHHAKLHDTSDRIKVGSLVNLPSDPFSQSLSTPNNPPALAQHREHQTSACSPSSALFGGRRYSPELSLAGDHRGQLHPPTYLVTGSERRRVTLNSHNGMYALVEAGEQRQEEERRRSEQQLSHRREDFEQRRAERSKFPMLHYRLPTPSTHPELWGMIPPKPETLTCHGPHSQTTERLPSFQELARLADETHEKKHGTDTGSSPAAIGYWQTSSTRTSRQSSTERPVFNDPFRGVPPSTPPLRASTQHIRPPSSTEHYTTQSEGRSLLLGTRPSPTSEYRRSSIRPEYEPRAPSVPSLFPQSRATSHDAGPPASRSQYYPSTAYSQPPQLPLSPHEARRASEVPYAHPGYGIAYSHDHYRHRPSWAPDSPNYARHYSRHDSTVYAPPEQHWAYGYAAPYAYSIDGVHHDGMGRKRRGNLPKEATAILKKWFQDHCESPYPTDEEKNKLAISTGLSNAQISNWFINARRRTPGREAREIARQNRANQQLIQGQQQAQGQEAGEEGPHSTQTTRPVPTQQPQQTEQLQQHHHNQRPQPQLEQQHSRLPAQEQQRLPPTESHYRHRGHSREVSGDQEMHDV